MTEPNRARVDEVHRRVGRNLLMFQAAEQSLRSVLPYIHPDGSKLGAEAMRKYAEEKISGKSLGLLMEQFRQAADGDKDLIAAQLKAFVDARNELVHHFFRNERFDLTKPDGVDAALWYLDEQCERARGWVDTFGALSAAVLLGAMEAYPPVAAALEPHAAKLRSRLSKWLDVSGATTPFPTE